MGTGIIECPEHGVIYTQPNVGVGSVIKAGEMIPSDPKYPRPTAGTKIICPICSKSMSITLSHEER